MKRYTKHEAFYGEDSQQAAVITDVYNNGDVEFRITSGFTFGWPIINTGARFQRLSADRFAAQYPNRVPFEKF